jgi:hypothetical protein
MGYLADLPRPVDAVLVTGDDRPVNQVRQVAGLTVALCDSTIPGQDDGWLADETIGWLDAVLDDTRDGPALVAMHHPPVAIGIPSSTASGSGTATASRSCCAGTPRWSRCSAGTPTPRRAPSSRAATWWSRRGSSPR